VHYSRYYSGICLEELRKPTQTVRQDSRFEIRAEYLQNTGLERYRWRQLDRILTFRTQLTPTYKL
jgi:hypothetical protein